MICRNWLPPRTFAVFAVLLGLLIAGCGGGPDLPEMAPVSGTVTLDGDPLTSGTVYFIPHEQTGPEGPGGSGTIDQDGHYEIRTLDQRGALVGTHRVRIECRGDFDPMTQSMGPSLIPEKYDDPLTSGLTAEVKAGEENEFDWPLTSQP